jgi:hypothetical protein
VSGVCVSFHKSLVTNLNYIMICIDLCLKLIIHNITKMYPAGDRFAQ